MKSHDSQIPFASDSSLLGNVMHGCKLYRRVGAAGGEGDNGRSM